MTLRTVLLSLQALLAAAEPDDPQDAVVANQVGLHVYFTVLKQSNISAYNFIHLSQILWDFFLWL